MIRASKFGAIKTVVDGIVFASRAESKRYVDLMMLVRSGEIRGLTLQPKFPLMAGGCPIPIATYIADFAYETSHGEMVIEDVKGMKTPMYRLKKKWLKAQYGIEIHEVTR